MSSASKKKRRKRRPRNPAPTAATASVQRTEAPKQAASAAKARPRRAPADDRPPAPWGSFPLVELIVFIGLIMIAIGFIVGFEEPRGQLLLGTGVVLAALAGLELSIREHFAGFRSHTLLLASAAGLVVMLGLYYVADLPPAIAIGAGAAAAVGAGFVLVRTFRRKSGGYSVKVR